MEKCIVKWGKKILNVGVKNNYPLRNNLKEKKFQI